MLFIEYDYGGAMTDKPIIQGRNIHLSFKEKLVLDNINISISKGEIFGLLGPSGAGKTSLLKILTGQLLPNQGEAKIDDCLSTAFNFDVYNELGIDLEDCGLFQRLSCYSNLKILAMVHKIELSQIDYWLERVGLSDARDVSANKLSKGMSQRLGFVRSIIHNPRILFLDEPTNALDPVSTKKVHDIILELRNKGTTIIIATHDMQEAYNLCDNVFLINHGKMIEYGNPYEICKKYSDNNRIVLKLKNDEVKEYTWEDRDIDEIVKQLKKHNVSSISSNDTSLEDVFILLTGEELNV